MSISNSNISSVPVAKSPEPSFFDKLGSVAKQVVKAAREDVANITWRGALSSLTMTGISKLAAPYIRNTLFTSPGNSPLERVFYQTKTGNDEVVNLPKEVQEYVLIKQNESYPPGAALIEGASYTYRATTEDSVLVRNLGGIFSPRRQELLGSFTRVTEEETFVTYAAFADQSGETKMQCTTTITQVSEELSVGQISISEVAQPISSTRCILIDDTK